MNISIKYYCLLVILPVLLSCSPNEKINVSNVYQCLPNQSQCLIKTPHGNFEVLFNVKEILTEEPFNIDIRYTGTFVVTEISSYMEGKEMYMGKIPVFFIAKDNIKNIFNAQTMLGSCSEEKMIWRLWLKIEGHEGNSTQTFIENTFIEFESKRI